MPTLKKLIIFSVSLIACFFIGIIIDLACGPEADPYDYYASFFHNTIQENDNYKSFYFNGMSFLNEDHDPLDEANVNSAEWAAHLGKGVLEGDVSKAMYEFNRPVDSLLLLNYLKPNGRLPDSLKKNTFLRVLVSGSNNEALQYYRFAKTLEPLTVSSVDIRWSTTLPDKKLMHAKAREAVKYAKTTADSFIKLRYYYQAQRLMYYAGEELGATKLYVKHIAGSKSKSHVKGWALSLRAGSEWRTGDPAKAAYLFSVVFARYPERRIQAFYEFNGIDIPIASITKFAKTPNQKAYVYAIKGFRNPKVSLSALASVYQCAPKSELIKMLLVREINKIEEAYLWSKINKKTLSNPYDYYNFVFTPKANSVKKQETYLPRLKAFCNRLANEGKYSQPALAKLAVAYLSWMQHNNSDGFKALASIKGVLTPALEDQKQMIKLLLLAQKINKLNRMNEAELATSLSWLDKKVKWEAAYTKYPLGTNYGNDSYYLKSYSTSARDFYKLVLSPIYLKQKDTAMAALVILRGDQTIPIYRVAPGFNMPDFLQRKVRSHDLKKMISLIKDRNKTPYLKVLTSEINQKLSYDIYDLLGTAYLREHKYVNAFGAFKNIPKELAKHTPYTDWAGKEYSADPFFENERMGKPTYKKTAYTKSSFALRMAKLENLVKTDPRNAAQYYYQIATGMYNTSYYGNAWYLIAYTWAEYDFDRKRDEYYDTDFLRASNAKKYYLKARALSKNKDFEARCTFMAAKCCQNQVRYPQHYYLTDKEYQIAINKYNVMMEHNPYFVELHQNYSKTAFYKLAINECSDFRDFIAGRKK